MKSKFFIVFVLFFWGLVAVYSQPRSKDDALNLALSFLNTSTVQGQRAPLDASVLEPVVWSDDLLSKSVYVFNISGNRGFVMVSGDERARDILAWSDRSEFDYQTIPDNFRYWISVYNDELKLLRSQPVVSEKVNNSSLTVQAVSPLLGLVKWDQGSPYNALCPVINTVNGSRAVTGCVATGMAQVMYYHRWPEKGTGSKSYTTKTLKIPLELDFSSTYYNWDKMIPQYGAASSDEAKTAVATIMYHAGVAVSMDYNSSSSAYFTDMGRALYQNFGYDPNLQLVFRNYMSRDHWAQVLMNELYAARPILYGGTQADESGHLWICDGVDQNGFFHFNWGWGGAYNGYFTLSALNPDELNGESVSGGYNYYQQAIIGLQKPSQSSSPVMAFYLNKPLEYTVPGNLRSQSFSINAQNAFNYGLHTVSFQLALGIYNGSSLVNVLKSFQINDLKSNFGWNELSFTNLTVPSSVSQGNYQLKLIHRTNSNQDWSLVPVRTGVPAWIDTRITNDSIVFSHPINQWPQLTLQFMSPIGSVYASKTGRFGLTVQNNGGEYNSAVFFKLTPLSGGESVFETSHEWLSLVTNESATITFAGTMNMPAGDYVMTAFYDVSNNNNAPVYQQLGDTVRIKIRSTPVTDPILTLQQPISFPSNNAVMKNNADLSATITNTGGYFENHLIAFIFTSTGSSSIGYLGYRKVMLDSLETATLHFKGEIAQEAGEYRIGVYQNTSNGWSRLAPSNWSMINFTLLNDTITSIIDAEANSVKIYPNPVTDHVVIVSENSIDCVEIFSTDGRKVDFMKGIKESPTIIDVTGLQPGVYLMKLIGESTKTVRFIKK
jgi:hypothetical protein